MSLVYITMLLKSANRFSESDNNEFPIYKIMPSVRSDACCCDVAFKQAVCRPTL